MEFNIQTNNPTTGKEVDALVRAIIDKLQAAGQLTPKPAVLEIYAGDRLSVTAFASLKEYATVCDRDGVVEAATIAANKSKEHPGAVIVLLTTPGMPLQITPVFLSEGLS
jgi:hypothetical protein